MMAGAVPILLTVVSVCPLAAAVFAFICEQSRLARGSQYVAALANVLSLAAAVALLSLVSNPNWVPQDATQLVVYHWIEIGGSSAFDVPIGLRVDTLSALWLVMLTFVMTITAINCCGSVAGRSQLMRSSNQCLLLSTTVWMLLASNLLQLFVFWQLLTVASVLLAGFRFGVSSTVHASPKMYLFNRITDVSFVMALFFVWNYFGTFEFSEVLRESAIADVFAIHPSIVGATCICLFAAALGRCAQFPAFVWLEGSLGATALANAQLHSVTMLPAGVYLVARCMPLFNAAPQAQMLMAMVGGLTVVLTGVIIAAQDDLRRILCYSTAGQLGMVLVALSTGKFPGIIAALFLLIGHALAKTMLFLSVDDAPAGRLRLRRHVPTCTWMFLIGAVVLASGLWGQSSVLAVVWQSADQRVVESQLDGGQPTATSAEDAPSRSAGRESDSEQTALGLAAADPAKVYFILSWALGIGVFLNALAVSRVCIGILHSEAGEAEESNTFGPDAHESADPRCIESCEAAEAAETAGASKTMSNVTLIVCTVAAALVGVVFGVNSEWVEQMLARTFAGMPNQAESGVHIMDWSALLLTAALSVSAVLLSWLTQANATAWTHRLVARMGAAQRLGQNRFYLDSFFELSIQRVLQALAAGCGAFERYVLEGLLRDRICRFPNWIGSQLLPLQNGIVQFYALSMLLTVAVLLVLLTWLGM